MKMFLADKRSGTIQEVNVERATDHFVWINGLKLSIDNGRESYHEKMEFAKNKLKSFFAREIEILETRISDLKKMAARLE